MRILITGAAGFIGSHLADRFRRDGHKVTGIDDLTTGSVRNWNGEGYELVVGDVANRLSFYAVANATEPDLVIHCAASYSDPLKWHRDVDTNVTGTINAVLVAQHHGARLVYFQTALPPITSYAISKIAGERYVALGGVPHLIFRLANVYGPRNLSGPIPTFYKRLTAGQPCTVTDTRRELVYVDDLVELVALAAVDLRDTGKYDVCAGSTHRIIELYDLVRRNLGSTALAGRVPAAPDDVNSMVLDPRETFKRFGWTPTTSLEDGVGDTIAWYARHGVTDTFTHLSMKDR